MDARNKFAQPTKLIKKIGTFWQEGGYGDPGFVSGDPGLAKWEEFVCYCGAVWTREALEVYQCPECPECHFGME